MTVSAAETRDPNGRPLEFHWRLLQGDPEKGHDRALRGRHQRDDHPRLARPLRHLRGQPGHHLPRRHRRLRLERRPRLRPGDPLLVLPPEREAPHRAGPRRRPAHRRDRPHEPRPRLRRPDPRPPRRLARRLRLRRRRQPSSAGRGCAATGRRRSLRCRRPAPARPGKPRHRCDGRLSAVAGRRRPARGRGGRRRPLLSRGSACCVAACSHPPGGTLYRSRSTEEPDMSHDARPSPPMRPRARRPSRRPSRW